MAHRVAVSLLLVTASWAPAALADADGPDFYAVTGVAVEDTLTVRAGPSETAEKVGEIPHDARGLRSLGCQGMPTFAEWQAMTPEERADSGRNHWCRVSYRGAEGWVAARFLREDGSPPADPTD